MVVLLVNTQFDRFKLKNQSKSSFIILKITTIIVNYYKTFTQPEIQHSRFLT